MGEQPHGEDCKGKQYWTVEARALPSAGQGWGIGIWGTHTYNSCVENCHEQVPVNFSFVDLTRTTVTEFQVPIPASYA